MGKDYYAILEVGKDADDNELKKGGLMGRSDGARLPAAPDHPAPPGALQRERHCACALQRTAS